MKHQSAENARIEGLLREFLSRRPLPESTLTLEGTGINAALQWVVLSMIGIDRLRELKYVNAISGSTFPLLLFLAWESEQFIWPREQSDEWEPAYRRAHGIVPLWTALRWLAGLAVRRPALSVDGHALAFRNTVREGFSDRKLADFDINIRVWSYNVDDNEMVVADRDGPLSEMTLIDLIKCSAGIPWLFGKSHYRGNSYIDPIYSPKMRELRQQFKSESDNSLISNMLVEKITPTQIFVRPHGYRSGAWLLFRDFAKFVVGLPNREVGDAGRNGLFDGKRIVD